MQSQPPSPPPRPPSLLLAVLVLTRDDQSGRRDGIIDAWAGALGSWPADSVRAFFVKGNPAIDDSAEGLVSNNATGQPAEAAIPQTLVVAAPEVKRHICLKVLRALRWLYLGAGALRPMYVAKTDDDTYICTRALLAALPIGTPVDHSSALPSQLPAARHLKQSQLSRQKQQLRFSSRPRNNNKHAYTLQQPPQQQQQQYPPRPSGDAVYMGAMTRGRAIQGRSGGKWEDAPHLRLFGLAEYPTYAQGAVSRGCESRLQRA